MNSVYRFAHPDPPLSGQMHLITFSNRQVTEMAHASFESGQGTILELARCKDRNRSNWIYGSGYGNLKKD
ncbi:hypothetical protein C1J03_11695 [Sulfitobacter sp. SK012]|uniref:hypothetical protein n=1 Tax=Sulfitobacter sp. SK012 TaxID=1389005 RepID=UPI000E0A2156|nr:hypothetical protein [Sulfitobacter sp. SK012]AXI46623.1 hypothetical protein C1J03_11695 [Sulfitobacter sp. SK012]